MKSILALATLALVVLALEEKTRQIAGEAQATYGEAVERARVVAANTSHAVKKQPLSALLIAGTVGFFLSWLTIRR